MVDASWSGTASASAGTASQIQALIDNINAVKVSGALSSTQVTALLAQLAAMKANLLTHGADPNNPIPPRPPLVPLV